MTEQARSPMLKVIAPIALVGLLATALAIVVAIEIKHRQLDAAATEFARAAVETIASGLSQTVWPGIRSVALGTENLPDQALAARAEVAAVGRTLERFARDTDVVAIKIFDLAGRTVYAPVAADIGRRSSSPAKIDAALAGGVATALYVDRTINGFAETRRFAKIVASYAPIRAPDGRVEAVLEFFVDMSKTSQETHDKLLVYEYGVAALLIGLYAAMMGVVWQTARLQARQNAMRLAAMASLAAERQRFADFSEISAGWVWETGPDHRFSFVSETFRALGVDPALRMGQHPAGWGTRNGIDGSEPALSEAMGRREAFRDCIVRVTLPGREPLWVARSGKPIFDAAGAFLGYRGADRDVTKQIDAERDLRLSNRVQSELLSSLEDVRARLELAMDTAAMGWWEFDGATGIQVWSARTCAIYGLETSTPASYERFQALLHPDDRVRRPDLTKLPAGRGNFSYRIVVPDGAIRHVREDYLVERGPSGELVRVFGTLLDFTDVERLRRDAERARATLDSALDSMAEGFLLCDADDRIVATNRKIRELFAATADTVPLAPGQRYEDVLAAKLAADMTHVTDDERAAYLRERLARRRAPGGAFAFAQADGTVIEVLEARGPDGSTVSLYRDVTKERRTAGELASAKQAAEEANRAKTRFLATMSHEIRTPMNGLLGMAELFAATDLDERQRGYLAVIERSAAALLTIIDDILDYSKLESGAMRLERGVFDPVELVGEAVALMSATADKKGLALAANAAPEVPRAVTGDATRVRQVLLNLLGNAIKFTQTGRISLGVELGRIPGAASVVFSVADTGIGIAPDAQARLFERFSQADETIARRFGGTGLGLAISRELVRLMGGELGVESREGAGSTFRFSVPLHAVDAAAAPARDAAPAPTAGAGVSLDLLVAEDNEINRIVVGEMLARMGHRHEFAIDGVEALAKAGAKRYDAILMDAQMPGMDGDEATRRIRQLPAPFAQVPIVALTANAMAGDREIYLAAGMNDYVSKPVRAADLAAALARATARRGAK